MKLKRVVAMTVVAALCLSFAGCQAKNNTNLSLATGGVSGTYYPFGGAISQVLNANIEGLNITPQSTGASAENIRLLGSNDSDLAIVQNDVMSYAYTGTQSFEGQKVEGFSTIATLYPEVVQIVAGKEINSIADLKGKKVSVGDAGSGVESNARQILSAYGITFDDIKINHLSFKESAALYQDGQLDAFFVTAGVPNSAIQEVSLQRAVKVLSIEPDIAAQLKTDYPFYINYTIPKDVYGTEEDTNTLAVKATLIVRTGLDENLVYEMTKALFEKQADIAAAHAKGKEISIDTAIEGASVPFHPGAIKYYKEKGLM